MSNLQTLVKKQSEATKDVCREIYRMVIKGLNGKMVPENLPYGELQRIAYQIRIKLLKDVEHYQPLAKGDLDPLIMDAMRFGLTNMEDRLKFV